MNPAFPFLVAVCLASAPLSAFAEPSSDASFEPSAAQAQARALFERARAAFREGKVKEAHTDLVESFRLHKSFDTAGVLGQTEIQLGEYRSAAEHLEYCLRNFATGEDRELLKKAQVAYSAVQQQVGQVSVTVSVGGAEVFVDDKLVGLSPLEAPLFVEAGAHTVRAVAAGASPAEEKFEIAKGERRSVELKVAEAPAPLASAPASDTSGEPAPSASSTSAVSASSPSGGPVEDTETGGRNWVPAYVLGGVTVASFVTSMVFRGMASSDQEDIDRLRGATPTGCGTEADRDCVALRDAADSHDGHAKIANVTMAVAGVGAAATVGYVVYTLLQQNSEAPVNAAVGLDPSGGSLLLSGQF